MFPVCMLSIIVGEFYKVQLVSPFIGIGRTRYEKVSSNFLVDLFCSSVSLRVISRWWVGSISVPRNHQSEQFYLIVTSVPHSTVNQKPQEMSPDALHSIKDQFCIIFMINHISFTSIPHIPISGTQQHFPILLLPLFLKLRILATLFPLFSLHLRFKKNQGLFYIFACLIYLWFLSIPLFPFGFNFAFPYIKFYYFTATFPSIETSCIYFKTTEK